MPQSLTQLYAHLIFSTKNREPFLTPSVRPRVHGYLASLMRDYDSPYVVVGGVTVAWGKVQRRPRIGGRERIAA